MKTHYFKTNIKRLKAAMTIANVLPHYFKGARVQFDAVTSPFIFKISAPKLSPVKVISALNDLGVRSQAV